MTGGVSKKADYVKSYNAWLNCLDRERRWIKCDMVLTLDARVVYNAILQLAYVVQEHFQSPERLDSRLRKKGEQSNFFDACHAIETGRLGF
ncbi:hypothetical protein PPTG_24768 [Phytophthora nicotianae INRA-310]|uniref:Uncharacterized protein n=1 Tax=Phytophthora nicotianae (strain INRA-310) TaxID=761204 RepID=W2PD84_PHYN3|nr:hypothetical protein PPTG_24768 [Phytophthora nicotianae INRA-310]ETM97979.1 hypothetical protein PPTG_24768 [Phytophthora nicotianae INRA-310]